MMRTLAIRIADEGAFVSALYGIIVLLGEEGRHWERYGGDAEWWDVHLRTLTWWN